MRLYVNVKKAIHDVKNYVSTKYHEVKTAVIKKAQEIKTAVVKKYQEVKTAISTTYHKAVNAIANSVIAREAKAVVNQFKSWFSPGPQNGY